MDPRILLTGANGRLGRYFQHGPEDFVFVSAQPQCDLAWLEQLDDAAILTLDQTEQLSLLERRSYRWECGCTQARMFAVLASVMKTDPDWTMLPKDIPPAIQRLLRRCLKKDRRNRLDSAAGAREPG